MTWSQSRCPACGATLDFAPWEGHSASDAICPCCGIQFGYDDAAGGDLERRVEIYEIWRHQWIENGMRWLSTSQPAPASWDPVEQLKAIEIEID